MVGTVGVGLSGITAAEVVAQEGEMDMADGEVFSWELTR